jgi:hypothetical protein
VAGHSIPRTLFYERADILSDLLLSEDSNFEKVYFSETMMERNRFWFGNDERSKEAQNLCSLY